MSPALSNFNLWVEDRSSPSLDACRRFQRNRAAVVRAWIIAVIVLASVTGPLFVDPITDVRGLPPTCWTSAFSNLPRSI
jgi:hypothetical protein